MPKYRITLTDGTVREVEAGTPDAAAQMALTPAAPEPAPSLWERLKRSAAETSPMAAWDFVKAHPAVAGSTAAAMLAAPFTGGMSIPAEMAVMGGAGALGAGMGDAVHVLTTGEPISGRDLLLDVLGGTAQAVPGGLARGAGAVEGALAQRAAAAGSGSLVDQIARYVLSRGAAGALLGVGTGYATGSPLTGVAAALAALAAPSAGRGLVKLAAKTPNFPRLAGAVQEASETAGAADRQAALVAEWERRAAAKQRWSAAEEQPYRGPSGVSNEPPLAGPPDIFHGDAPLRGFETAGEPPVVPPPRYSTPADLGYQAVLEREAAKSVSPLDQVLNQQGPKYRELQRLFETGKATPSLSPADVETANLAARHFGRELTNTERAGRGDSLIPTDEPIKLSAWYLKRLAALGRQQP